VTGSLNHWIGTVGIDYAAFADYVIADYDGAGTREAKRPFEVGGIVWLVGVDEDEVEGWGGFGVELGERFEGWAEA